MRSFLDFVTALILLACLNYLTVALGIVLIILVLMSAITYPRRTLQLVTALGLLALVLKEPTICAVALGAGGVAIAIIFRARHIPASPMKQLPAPQSRL